MGADRTEGLKVSSFKEIVTTMKSVEIFYDRSSRGSLPISRKLRRKKKRRLLPMPRHAQQGFTVEKDIGNLGRSLHGTDCKRHTGRTTSRSTAQVSRQLRREYQVVCKDTSQVGHSLKEQNLNSSALDAASCCISPVSASLKMSSVACVKAKHLENHLDITSMPHGQ